MLSGKLVILPAAGLSAENQKRYTTRILVTLWPLRKRRIFRRCTRSCAPGDDQASESSLPSVGSAPEKMVVMPTAPTALLVATFTSKRFS